MTTSPARTGLRSGIDTSSLAPAVRPQDDLFRHVNGRWLAEHEIPADRAMDGAFRLLHDQTEEHVRAIITELGDDGPDMLLGLVVQQAERAVHGAVGGDLVLGPPTSVHVPEQV